MTTAVKSQPTWILKGCSWCGGDLYPEDDGFHCLQCGRRRVGKVGDIQTFLRYSPRYMREIVKRGGRPQLITLNQLRQQAASRIQDGNNGGRLPTTLVELKKLYKLRNKAGEGN